MENQNVKNQIAELTLRINEANEAYYVENNPIVTDKYYDITFANLVRLEKEYPELATPDSPTQRVGDDRDSIFEKVEHIKPMLSISNSYDVNDVTKFVNDTGADEYLCELKIDGLGLEVRYFNGILVEAVTRGNGMVGDGVLMNAKTIKDIPLKLNDNFTGQVRGEVFIEKSSFAKINAENDGKYANPRNLAAGSLKQKNSKITAKRSLRFNAYWINDETKRGALLLTQYCELNYLQTLGFSVCERYELCESIEDILEFIELINKKRSGLDIPIDGIVIKVNDKSVQKKIGFKSSAPKFFTAFKFEPEKVTTKLLDVTFQIGRTGVITPVAELESVFLDGSNVKRATLHNFENIKRLGLHYGDTVVIEKAGDIIPQVVSVETRLVDSSPVTAPEKCPSCGESVFMSEEEVAIRCINPDCPEQVLQQHSHFLSTMNIKSLGFKSMKKIIESGIITSLSDWYYLKVSDISSLDRMGIRSAEKIVAEIQKSKNMPAYKVLASLGISNVGNTVSKQLYDEFGDFATIRENMYNGLINIKGIGDTIRDSFNTAFGFNGWADVVVDELEEAGLKFVADVKIPVEVEDNFFSGKNFVVTGTLDIKRKEAQNIIEERGGNVQSSVSKTTNILICGEKSGSKKSKAEALGIQIIENDEFMELIGE